MQNKIKKRRIIIKRIKKNFSFVYNFIFVLRFILFGYTRSHGVYIFYKQKILLQAIYKSGCSSFLRSLTEKEIKINENLPKPEEGLSTNRKLHDYIKENLYYPTYKKNDYKKFTVVRNPFDRIVSCYKDKVLNSKKNNNKISLYDQSKFVKRIMSMDEVESFEDFVNKVIKISDYYSDPHIRSQYFSIKETRFSESDMIIKIEELNDKKEEVKNFLEIQNIFHENKTKKDNWMDYYTKNTAEKIHKRYKDDFNNLGYKNEFKKLLSYIDNKNNKN